MDNLYDLGLKRETNKEEGKTDELLKELNDVFYKNLSDQISQLESSVKNRQIVIEGVLGTSITDFVLASILLYHASYFLNRMNGKTLNLSSKLNITDSEIENLSTLLLTRLLRVERQRFEEQISANLKSTPLFRRIKKRAVEMKGELTKVILRKKE